MSNPQRVSADQIVIAPGEVLIDGIDFTNFGLASGETLTGSPTVAGDGLTVASAAVNAATFEGRKGQTVGIGKGVMVTISGGVAGTDYDMTVSCATTAGQTLKGTCPVLCRAT